ncbi:MAG: tyrosine-type recombinase/integrase [Methanobacterium sp.]|nr:tyrosine-type recombinase/integrase [Methanobacterium sp.]
MNEPVRINLPYVVQDMDRHGNVRVYVRRHRNGRKKRIKAPIGTAAFMTEYEAALAALAGEEKPASVVREGSLRWLCQKYYSAPAFKTELKVERTRTIRRNILDCLCAASTKPGGTPNGDKPYALLQPKHIREWRDNRAETPEAANALVKALRQLFKFGISYELAETNPARDVPYLRSNNPDGFHAWSVEEVEQYEEYHPIGSKGRLAMALLLFTGVRRSDVVRLGPQMVRAGVINFTEIKGRDRIVKQRQLPILPELQAILDATPSGHLAYLVTEFGKPFTANGFGNWFRDRCDEAHLPQCSAHGLRKAGATIAADNGATEHQLMALFGWESPKQAAIYTKKANRKKLAATAAPLLVPDREGNSGNKSVPPKTRKSVPPPK